MTAKELLDRLNEPTVTYRCSKCGKTIEIPHLMNDKERGYLKPYCWSFMVFAVQYLIHEGWHIRDLGLSDSHPYFCPDCWKEGIPEFKKRDCCDEWYEQSQAWLKSKNNK